MSMLAAFRGLGYCTAVVATAAVAIAPPAGAGSRHASSCTTGYSYVGAESPAAAAAVSATIRLSARPAVAAGHVAAWVGVGGAALGPAGSSEWLQAGVAQEAGGEPHLYYELRRPQDDGATYVSLGGVAPGEGHTFTVSELSGQRDVWAASIDGLRVATVTLPGSHGAFEPVATAENWDGGIPGTCNRYGFEFSNLGVRADAGRAWQPFILTRLMRDPAYTLLLRPGGFTAAAR